MTTPMVIQDYINAVCNWGLAAALLFSLQRPRLHITGPVTALLLFIMAANFATIEFGQSTLALIATGGLWVFISCNAIGRRIREGKRVK